MSIEKKNRTGFNEGVIAGRNPVLEALKSGVLVDKLYIARGEREGSIVRITALAAEKGIPVQEADRVKLDFMSGVKTHQGIVAYITPKEYVSVESIVAKARDEGEPPLILVAENLSDPHNLGAIIRTAEAAGAHGLIISKNRSVGLTPAAVKASAGAAFHMDVARVSNIADTIARLKELGLWIYGAAGEAAASVYDTDFKGAAAIVIGSEGQGLSRLVRERCDFLVSIPMNGRMSSLNASVAAALIMYEAVRQRSCGGGQANGR